MLSVAKHLRSEASGLGTAETLRCAQGDIDIIQGGIDIMDIMIVS